jgi:cell division protein FtsL
MFSEFSITSLWIVIKMAAEQVKRELPELREKLEQAKSERKDLEVIV